MAHTIDDFAPTVGFGVAATLLFLMDFLFSSTTNVAQQTPELLASAQMLFIILAVVFCLIAIVRKDPPNAWIYSYRDGGMYGAYFGGPGLFFAARTFSYAIAANSLFAMVMGAILTIASLHLLLGRRSTVVTPGNIRLSHGKPMPIWHQDFPASNYSQIAIHTLMSRYIWSGYAISTSYRLWRVVAIGPNVKPLTLSQGTSQKEALEYQEELAKKLGLKAVAEIRELNRTSGDGSIHKVK